MFAGPSGIGKTTMAQIVSRDYDIPFYSGSMRDLMPEILIYFASCFSNATTPNLSS